MYIVRLSGPYAMIHREHVAFWSDQKPAFRGLWHDDMCHLWYGGSYTSFKAGI